MPNASSTTISWSNDEFSKLIGLVKSYPVLYNESDPSRKNILARETSWKQISEELDKPVEDCKKRWRMLRDSYMRVLRTGAIKNFKKDLFSKLDFLSMSDESGSMEEATEEQVIMDNQEYYEVITLVDEEAATQDIKPFTNKLPITKLTSDEPPKKIGRKNCGRKRYTPCPPPTLPPIKILPKPININGPKIIHYLEEPKVNTPPVIPQPSPQKSEVIDKLIEKVLKEHTNEIDVFFRSMAASVKKLQPNLIPKVKMEVCNVIAKYEMQSFEKNGGNF